MAAVRIPREQYVYAFSAATPPVASVAPGATLVLETYDASTGRIHAREDVHTYARVRDPLKVNPAAGPVYVEGAAPGDALVVDVLDIRLAPQGFVRTAPGAGVVQAGVDAPDAVIVRVSGDRLVFDERVELPARPMVGVIGTAPAEGVVYTGSPGPQGSNLDVNAITIGARVYLPVHVPGALLVLGDVHASMGDGEVSGTGVEINAEVTVRVGIEPGQAPARPWIETPQHWVATGSGPTLEAAVEQAVGGLCDVVQRRLTLTRTEAFMLVSACGDVRVGQCARIPGLDSTAYALFPRAARRLR
jgi:amidase